MTGNCWQGSYEYGHHAAATVSGNSPLSVAAETAAAADAHTRLIAGQQAPSQVNRMLQDMLCVLNLSVYYYCHINLYMI